MQNKIGLHQRCFSVLTRDEYYLQLFSKWTGNGVESMVAAMKLADDLAVNILPTTQGNY